MPMAHMGRALLMAAAFGVHAYAADLLVVLNHAQQSVDQANYSAAIDALEKTLPDARGNQQLLSMLRQAYRGEIRRLMAASDNAAAQKYADRLRLLEQLPEGTSSASETAVDRRGYKEEQVKVITPQDTPPRIARPVNNKPEMPAALDTQAGDKESPSSGPLKSASTVSGWKASSQPIGVETARPAEKPTKTAAPSVKVLAVRPAKASATSSFGDASKARSLTNQADALFLVRRYEEAAELYAQANRLSLDSIQNARDRWAYCRLASAVGRINQQPNSPEQWAAIQSDVRSVLDVIPRKEFAQSLLAMADGLGMPANLASASSETIIRANEPDRAENKGANLLTDLASRIGLYSSEEQGKRSLWQRFRSGSWQVLETSNFRIHYTDENLAGQAADIAESTRIELYRTWYGHLPEANWNPKCDIFIHDSADAYNRATHQGPASPGHSQTSVDRGRIASRRIDLRRDGPDLIHAILPHETTHVVLADRFMARAMPRWADEGMAVLTEPVEKKQAHLRNLADFQQKGRLFTARQLMTMSEYPAGNLWGMFYAESVSLVEFLVNRTGPKKFIEFMEGAIQSGYEGELKRVYDFASFEELDRAWSRGRVEQVAAARN